MASLASGQFTELPIEVINQVLEFLTSDSWINLSKTCRLMYSATLPFLWGNVQIGQQFRNLMDYDHEQGKKISVRSVNTQKLWIGEWPHIRQLTVPANSHVLEHHTTWQKLEPESLPMQNAEPFLEALRNGDISKRALESIRSVTIYCGYRFNEITLERIGKGSVGSAMSAAIAYDFTLKYLKDVFLNPQILRNVQTFGVISPTLRNGGSTYVFCQWDMDAIMKYTLEVFQIIKGFDSSDKVLYLSGIRPESLSTIVSNKESNWKVEYLNVSVPRAWEVYETLASVLQQLKDLRVLEIGGDWWTRAGFESVDRIEPLLPFKKVIGNAIMQMNSLEVLSIESSLLGYCFDLDVLSAKSPVCHFSLDMHFGMPFPEKFWLSWDKLVNFNLNNLSTLSLNVTMSYLQETSLFAKEVSFHNLVELHWLSHYNVPPILFNSVVKSNRGLKRVVVVDITEDGIESLAQHCYFLETFCILGDNSETQTSSCGLKPVCSLMATLMKARHRERKCTMWPFLRHLFIPTFPSDLGKDVIDSIVGSSPELIHFALTAGQRIKYILGHLYSIDGRNSTRITNYFKKSTNDTTQWLEYWVPVSSRRKRKRINLESGNTQYQVGPLMISGYSPSCISRLDISGYRRYLLENIDR